MALRPRNQQIILEIILHRCLSVRPHAQSYLALAREQEFVSFGAGPAEPEMLNAGIFSLSMYHPHDTAFA
jgi:hypothetical protein